MDVDDFIISGDSDAAAPIPTSEIPQEDGPAGQDIVSVMPPTNDKGDDDIDNEQINRLVRLWLSLENSNCLLSFVFVVVVLEESIYIDLIRSNDES